MATYLILNLVVIIAVCIGLREKPSRPSKAWVISLTSLLLLTAVFDNLIIAKQIVGYDTSKLLGIYLGAIPIEDFMYAILAVILVPATWRKIGVKHDK